MPVPCTMDGEKHLVQMPRVAGSRTPAPEFIRIRLTELAAPLPDGFVGHDHPRGVKEFFDIAVAETETDYNQTPWPMISAGEQWFL
jgi:hypothetical protein